MYQLDQEFDRLCQQPSDINEHLSLLRGISMIYPHITEMGVRYGVSTTAFLAGHPDTLVSYDIVQLINPALFQAMAPSTKFQFILGNSLEVEIAPTHVLFIDTRHNEDQLYAELTRHHRQVRSHILLHDTETFGEHGECSGRGLRYAIAHFLMEHKNWWESNHYVNNNGLTILSNSLSRKN